jgi:hypothetical protein
MARDGFHGPAPEDSAFRLDLFACDSCELTNARFERVRGLPPAVFERTIKQPPTEIYAI